MDKGDQNEPVLSSWDLNRSDEANYCIDDIISVDSSLTHENYSYEMKDEHSAIIKNMRSTSEQNNNYYPLKMTYHNKLIYICLVKMHVDTTELFDFIFEIINPELTEVNKEDDTKKDKEKDNKDKIIQSDLEKEVNKTNEEKSTSSNTLLTLNANALNIVLPKKCKNMVNFSNFFIFSNSIDFSVIIFLVVYNSVTILKIFPNNSFEILFSKTYKDIGQSIILLKYFKISDIYDWSNLSTE